VGEDPAQSQPVVRLDRRHHDDLPVRPAALELGLEGSDVPSQLILRHHVEGRAETLGEAGGVAAFDKESAFLNRKAIVDGAVPMTLEKVSRGSIGSYALDLLTDTTSVREAHIR
jgi:hypothetical protein